MKTTLVFAAVLLCAAFAASARASAVEDPGDRSGNDLLCMSWGCVGGSVFAHVSEFHGPADQDWGSNEGGVAGLELAAPVPVLGDWGVGVQASVSHGWYDFDGRGSTPDQSLLQQTLYSAGVFRRPDPDGPWYSRWGLGAVEDVAVDHAFGTVADAFTIHQIREKASYVIHGGHEVGVWATQAGPTTTLFNENSGTSGGPNNLNSYRAFDQTNLFYKYSFAGGGHVTAYWGPGRTRAYQVLFLTRNSPYENKYVLGADFAAPLSDYAQYYGGFAYSRPQLTPRMSDNGQIRRAYNLQAGVRVLWGGNARVRDDAGRHWAPYLPGPDNGNMLTNTNMND